MSEEDALARELKEAREQIRSDRRLIERAASALAEIDRGGTFSEEHADVLAALRIRLEGKARAKLEDLLTAAGDIKGGGKKKDLGDLLGPGEEKKTPGWPEVPDKKLDWPGA